MCVHACMYVCIVLLWYGIIQKIGYVWLTGTMHVYRCVCMIVYMYVCMHASDFSGLNHLKTCKYVYIRIHTYIHTYIHRDIIDISVLIDLAANGPRLNPPIRQRLAILLADLAQFPAMRTKLAESGLMDTMYKYVLFCVFVCVCEHAYRHTHTHTYTHTYIHTYIYTCSWLKLPAAEGITRYCAEGAAMNIHTYTHAYIHTYM